MGDLDADGAANLVAIDGLGALAAFRGDGRGDVVASFAQERAAGAEADACPSEGGLAAWRSLALHSRRPIFSQAL